jgi:hypothetical protein
MACKKNKRYCGFYRKGISNTDHIEGNTKKQYICFASGNKCDEVKLTPFRNREA